MVSEKVGKVGKVDNSGVSAAPWRREGRKVGKVGNSGVPAAPMASGKSEQLDKLPIVPAPS
eukprot:1350878-Lingulodinium_polyedra.AAC.1